MIYDGYDLSKHTPFSIYLLNVERGRIEFPPKEGRHVGTYTNTYHFPIEDIMFKTEEEAHTYAQEQGLKEDEYSIDKWML